MKVKFFTTISILLFGSMGYAAILLVNNNSGGPGQYTQLDPAIAAASPGDTVYVSGSATNYNDFTIDKSIVLIGPGSLANKQISVPATVNVIAINSNVSDITIAGFSIANGISLVNQANIHNVRIMFNYLITNDAINIYGLDNASNLLISNNIFEESSGVVIYCSNTTAVSNVTIENNIIRGSISSMFVTNAIIRNNVFYNHSGPSGMGAFFNYNGTNVSNALIINNIFYNSHPTNYTSACVFQNNITYSSSITYPLLNVLDGNINNTNPQFVNVPNGVGFSPTHNFHLQTGSPAIGSGFGGTDMGFYGGSNPVTVTLEPNGVPVIRQMYLINGNVPQNGNVDVKVRSTKPREH